VKRLLILLPVLAAATLLGSSSTGLSAERVIGGTQIQVQQAPWAVSIRQSTSSGALLCTGSVLDSLHILTAGHCVFDENGNLAPIASFSVRAGISNFNSPLATDVEQDRSVSSFRIHPGYAYSPTASPDDVAVLALNEPLDLTGPAVQQAPLPSAGGAFPAGESVELAGFGRESSSGSSNGSLNELTATVDEQGDCGGFSNTVEPYDDAIALCAEGSNNSICSGDSGSGLVSTDASHMLVAVASAAPATCDPSSHGIYVYVGAPEILSFIQGNNSPSTAPRINSTTYVDLFAQPPIRVGTHVTCESGNWDNTPTLTYAFIDSEHDKVLQQSSSGSLVLNAQTVGAKIACRAIATNAGGTAVLETTSTSAVGVAAKLGIEHIAAVTGKRGRRTAVKVWLDPGVSVIGKYGVCIKPPKKVAPEACASRRVSQGGGRVPFAISLKISSKAPVGAAKLAISAIAGASHGQTTAVLHVTK
jgi:hypothetical protein